MENGGIIRGYHADVELKKIAPHVVVFVVVELESHRAENFQTFEQAVGRCDEITGCWALGGGFDYLLQIITSDIDSYQRLIDGLLERPLGLKRYFTYFVTKQLKTGGEIPFASIMSVPEAMK